MTLKLTQVKTREEALDLLERATHAVSKNGTKAYLYEKEQASTVAICARLLCDKTHFQILHALSHLDKRIAYWQYQKDHPWDYFMSKNPLKWIIGPSQQEEVESNLELLKRHQGDLYLLLGQLSKLENVFSLIGDDTLVRDYITVYAWIDELLRLLMHTKIPPINTNDSALTTRAQLLKAKLENVDTFKNDLLADIPTTAIPHWFTRNWLKLSILLLGVRYGYKNFYDQFVYAVNSVIENFDVVVDPVKKTINDLFYPGYDKGVDINGAISSLPATRENVMQSSIDFVHDASKRYHLEEYGAATIKDLQEGGQLQFKTFLEKMMNKESLWKPAALKKGSTLPDYVHGLLLFVQLFGVDASEDIQNLIAAQQQQFAAVSKLILLTPAILLGWLAYLGYQKWTKMNYTPLRHELVEIDFLFIDKSEQLNDEQYGKMLYLISMLKKQAVKMLPERNNLRSDFIHDLERIELQEIKVGAKRAIVEDMFRKYDFLGLIQNK